MQVRVLGEVEVVAEAPIALGGPNQRRMLAALAIRRGEVVSVPWLADVVWPDGTGPARAEDGRVDVDEVDGIAPEYRAAALRYFGDEQGTAWCDQLPAVRMTRFRLQPEWVGVVDFDGMRRLPSALAG